MLTSFKLQTIKASSTTRFVFIFPHRRLKRKKKQPYPSHLYRGQ